MRYLLCLLCVCVRFAACNLKGGDLMLSDNKNDSTGSIESIEYDIATSLVAAVSIFSACRMVRNATF